MPPAYYKILLPGNMKHVKQSIARDLSWLSFNERVMQEAKDKSNSLYDRLRFLGIFSNNQDEFFRIRVATLTRMTLLKKSSRMHLEQNPEKVLEQIQQVVLKQQQVFNNTYTAIIREMAKENIYIRTEKQLSTAQKIFVQQYFEERVRTEIVPLMIESIPQMPLLHDKAIYLACVLGNSDNTMMQRYSIIEVPTENLDRFILLPSEEGRKDIILLEDIIRFNLPNIFGTFGFNRFMSYIIKFTRDAEFDIDNDVSTNLIAELEKGIKSRKKGKATRFVYEKSMDAQLLEYLTRRLNLSKKDNLIPGERIHNFKDFMNFPVAVFKKTEHVKQKRKPFTHPALAQPCRIMDVLERRDVMLHFPYHSFDALIDLLREAAIDPNVQSIKITCYRLAKNSKIINALINAVRNGKQVTAVLEVRARFEEEANMKWKTMLEDEGVKVVMGFPDMKVHAKLCVIRKKEFNRIREYGFVSTGNFNENTAKLYSDHCLLTANKKILQEAGQIFSVLETGISKLASLRNLKYIIASPISTRDHFIKLIDKEIKEAKKKRPAAMIIKLNSLVDDMLIHKIYEAARAGVHVKLIIRGICCVLSEQQQFKIPIQAISIIDEYLEHGRTFIFHNEGSPLVYISSADWMLRNLDHRIEVTCPISDKHLIKELTDILNIQLSDNVKARVLNNAQDNHYVKHLSGAQAVRAQAAIYEYLEQKMQKR